MKKTKSHRHRPLTSTPIGRTISRKGYRVDLGNVKRQLRYIPEHVLVKLTKWVEGAQAEGLPEMRKLTGYHDEPLIGKRKGERSIRLSRGWRAIYKELDDGEVIVVEVLEVTAHDYRKKS